MVLLSAISLAKVNAGFSILNLVQSYLLPGTVLDNLYPKMDADKKPLAKFLIKFIGQHDVPWVLLSLAVVKSGTVSKDYMLASTGMWCFFFFDITFRVLPDGVEHGLLKKSIIPYIPVCAVFGLLNFLAYRAM
mmetsp:Transcript_66343/g.130714  ORF Transcript_66343/g.130714 Transcript_66343/m.130714 type:complete len:133 (+) Transcript_66343:49-447(+)